MPNIGSPLKFERLVFLDTETTGLEPEKGHRICEIGAVEYFDNILTGRQYHVYLNPGREVDKEASKVNGLNLQKLKNYPKFYQIVRFIDSFLPKNINNNYIVAHNAYFDISFIKAEMERFIPPGLMLDKYKTICTKEIAKKMYPNSKNSLSELCDRFEVDRSHRVFHGALLDAKLLSVLFFKLIEQPEFKEEYVEVITL